MKADPTRPSAKAPPGYVSRSRAEQRTCHYTVVPRHTYLWLPGWSHGNYYGSDHRQVAWRADRGARVRDLAAFIAGGELAALRLRVLTEAARLIRPSRLDGYATIHRGRATVTAEQADAHVYRIRAELLRHPVTQRFPEAVAVVGEAALEAALRRLPAATCRWCWAKLDAEVNDWDPPKYDTLTRALLGPACDDCRRALAPTRSVHKDQLRREQTRARGQTAAVLPPAGNLPHPRRVRAVRADPNRGGVAAEDHPDRRGDHVGGPQAASPDDPRPTPCRVRGAAVTADPLMVAALLDGLGRPGYDDLLAEASGADVCAAAQALARAARPPRPLLQATYRELTGLADDAWSKAKALRWLADRLYPVWACRPDTPLGDVLKRRGPDEVDWIRATLADARIDLDR